jgi:hypothetical protein
MKVEIYKMFREDGSRVQLIDFLRQLPQNEWIWFFLWFDGIGIAPNGLSMEKFQETIRSNPTGFKMEWEQLIRFAEKIDQTIDCLLVAVKEVSDLHISELKNDNFSSCMVALEAFDSTEWKFVCASTW